LALVLLGSGTALAIPAGVSALVADPKRPSTVYAALEGFGVFKSVDAGRRWKARNAGLQAGIDQNEIQHGRQLWVGALAIDRKRPRTVYSGTDCGVYKSHDAGATWHRSSRGIGAPSACITIGALALDPKVPSVLYAGSRGDGRLFKSTNGGRRWRVLLEKQFALAVVALAIDPGRHRTVYTALDAGGTLRSVDGGAHWESTGYFPIDVATSLTSLVVGSDHSVYAGTADVPIRGVIGRAAIFKSTDGGRTWSDVTPPLPYTDFLALAMDPRTPTTVYAGTSGKGVFRTQDAGQTWVSASTGLTGPEAGSCGFAQCVDVTTFAWSGRRRSRLYVGTFRGADFDTTGRVFESTDAGRTWTERSAGLPP
jgi:photosystem II stability/assembly factor-like uncharacterized protein